jgi:hypothetical protein
MAFRSRSFLTAGEKFILFYLAAVTQPTTLREIAEATGLSESHARVLCKDLVSREFVLRKLRGGRKRPLFAINCADSADKGPLRLVSVSGDYPILTRAIDVLNPRSLEKSWLMFFADVIEMRHSKPL